MEIHAPQKVDITEIFPDIKKDEEYVPLPRVNKEKKGPIVYAPLTMEQVSTLKFALAVAIHSCKIQKDLYRTISDKYLFDKLINAYEEITEAATKARVKREKKGPIVYMPLHTEQIPTLKLALNVAIHSCEIQKDQCRSDSDKYGFDKLIKAYEEIAEAATQAGVDWVDKTLKEQEK